MKYNILSAKGGNVINTITADEKFVQANFEHYELYVAPTPAEPTAEQAARMWRDMELQLTDKAAQTPDWPNRNNILSWRQELRDWPSTSDFPNKRPTIGTE